MQEVQIGKKKEIVVIDHNCYSYFGVDDDQSCLWRDKEVL